MDPSSFYNNNSQGAYNPPRRPASANQHLNPNNPNSQIVNNGQSVPVPNNLSAGQAAAGGGGVPGASYPTSFNPQGSTANNAQYRLAAAAVAAAGGGRPLQPQPHVYGGTQASTSVPQTQQQHVVVPNTAAPRQQQMYNVAGRPSVASPPAANYSVPNPLGLGGPGAASATAPSAGVAAQQPPVAPPPSGVSKTDLLRSMYQSRARQQQQPVQNGQVQPVQQQGQQQSVQQPTYRSPSMQPQQHAAYAAGVQKMQQSASNYRQSPQGPAPVQPQQGVQQSYQQQQRSATQMASSHAQLIQQQSRQIAAQPMQQAQQVQQQRQQVTHQAYQQQQQASRLNVHQYTQQQQQTQQQQAQQQQARQASTQAATQQQQQQQQQQKSQSSGKPHRFHLTPEAKVALREAVLSAIRHPSGEVDPGCLQRAMAQGLPKQAILNAAVVARQRDRRNREERRAQQRQGGQQQGQGVPQQQGVQQQQQPSRQVHGQQPPSVQQLQQQGTVVHNPGLSRSAAPNYPPPNPAASAKTQMQQMFSAQQKAGTAAMQYNQTTQQQQQFGQTAQQQQQSRLYQQQQQAQQQAAQQQAAQQQAAQQRQRELQQQQAQQQQAQQQQINRQQQAKMTQYQRQLQAQQVNIAQQRKIAEEAQRTKQALQLQYQQEQQRRAAAAKAQAQAAQQKRRQAAQAQEKQRKMLEEQKKQKEREAAKAAAEAHARRNAAMVAKMKPWGRTGFALLAKGCAKGLPPPQSPQHMNKQNAAQHVATMSKAILRQSTWGGTSLSSDKDSALLGALKRVADKKGNGSLADTKQPENVQRAVELIRKRLLTRPQLLLADKVRSHPSRDQLHRRRFKAISAKLLPQPDQLKRFKLQPKRESKFLDKHIRRARQMTADAHSKRHKELLKAITSHQSEFYKFHRSKRSDAAKLARNIRDQHRKAEVAKEKEEGQAEKARLAALRSNDMAAYTSLLEDTKNERLKFLLDKTDECMNQISTLLASRVAEEEEDIKLMGGEGTMKATFSENVTGGSYYETAHVKSEQVRQPSILTGGDLKEYQLGGLQWMVSLYNNRLNGILADEMGLGKTIQTIALLAYLIEAKQNLGPYLVIVPLSTLSNWVNEFAKWLPAANVICYKGTPQQRKQLFRDEVADGHFNVLLTTYEFVIRDKGSLKKLTWQYAIVDEGHRMKNNQSKFSVTLGTHYNTRRRVLLTGTPLQNNLPELWALLNFLLPAIFNSAETFDQWFNKPFSSFGKSASADDPDGSSNELLSNEERMLIIHRLHELLRPFMLRRVKSEVLDQLPTKVEKVIRCELSSWQKELYKQISHKIAGEAATKNFNRGLNNVVMQLRKVCNHPYLFSQDGYHINEDVIRTSGKMELLDRMLPKLKAAGHRVLMFTQMTKMMPILEDYFAFRGFSSLRLDGSTTADEREKRMYMFNAPDSPYFVFLLSTRAGGLGLNLATADTVIIFDSDWNPMMDLQAQDRAHRIGQRKDVRVFRIITQTPVEEKILSRATEKLQMNELVVEAGKFDKSGQGKEDNSLERLKMMELLLTDFDQNQKEQSATAATSEEDFENDANEGEEEENKDLLNEMISSNNDDYNLYCKMDLERTDAPALYDDVKDCPDWILYPNGKPEEGDELLDDGHPELLGKRRAAAGDKMYDDGLTEKQFCRMMDKQATEEENGKKKRKKKRNRNAVDPSLILDDDGGGRKRSKTKHPELDTTPSRSKPAALSAINAEDGMTAATFDRLISVTRSIIYFKEKGTKRKLSEIFLEKPCPQTYPDYYQLIEKPIGMNDILRKCRAKLYANIKEFREDWKTLFENAVTYNGKGSWIVNDGDVLKRELDRLMDKNALSADAATSKKPAVRIKLSFKKGKKKKSTTKGGGRNEVENDGTPAPAAATRKRYESQSELNESVVDSGDESEDSFIEEHSGIVGMEERETSSSKRGKIRSGGLGSRGGNTRLVRRSG